MAGMPSIVFVKENGGAGLSNFNDTVVARLKIREIVLSTDNERNYLILARVVITIWDGDPQNAGVQLTADDGATVIDKVSVRIPGKGHSQTVSLIGNLTVRDDLEITISLRCASFNAQASDASIYAILVNGFYLQ